VLGEVEELGFDTIKNWSGGPQFVLFYHASESSSADALKMVRQVEKKLQKELPKWKFRTCNGDLSTNKAQFTEAAFNAGEFYFTATLVEGIEKYSGEQTIPAIVEHIRSFEMPYKEEDVTSVSGEDEFYEILDKENDPKPIFVKFFETWCTHCQRIKLAFNRLATYFTPSGVDFVEVECGKNDDTKAFCTRNQVTSYPTFVLFTGEQKIPFGDEARSLGAFRKFFKKQLPTFVDKKATTTSEPSSSPSTSSSKKEKKIEDKSPSPAKEDKSGYVSRAEFEELKLLVTELQTKVKSLENKI